MIILLSPRHHCHQVRIHCHCLELLVMVLVQKFLHQLLRRDNNVSKIRIHLLKLKDTTQRTLILK